MIDCSILICTYNRAPYLALAIDSCLRQTLPPDQFEIVVVDNRSTDATPEVVAALAEGAPNLRYVLEPQQGLNHARNRGAREAVGEFVAYIDDDARADPDWLEGLLGAFRGCDPTPAGVGGKVALDWEGARPAWYPPEFDTLMAYLDLGDQGFFLKPGNGAHYLMGTNMAFQRKTLLALDGFQQGFGRVKRRTLSGEEADLIARLLRRGEQVWYEPAARVTHSVVPERRTCAYLRARVIGDGETQPLIDLDQISFTESAMLRRVLFDLRLSLDYLLQSAIYRMRGSTGEAYRTFLWGCQRWGRAKMELKLLYHPEYLPLWRERIKEPGKQPS